MNNCNIYDMIKNLELKEDWSILNVVGIFLNLWWEVRQPIRDPYYLFSMIWIYLLLLIFLMQQYKICQFSKIKKVIVKEIF